VRKSLLVLIMLLVLSFQLSCEAGIKMEEDKVWGGKSFRVEKVLMDRSGGQSSVKETITFEKFIKPQITGCYIGYDFHGYFYKNQNTTQQITKLKTMSYRIEGSDTVNIIDVSNAQSESKQDVLYITGQFLLMPDEVNKFITAEKIYFEILYLNNKAVRFTIDRKLLEEWKEVINNK